MEEALQISTDLAERRPNCRSFEEIFSHRNNKTEEKSIDGYRIAGQGAGRGEQLAPRSSHETDTGE